MVYRSGDKDNSNIKIKSGVLTSEMIRDEYPWLLDMDLENASFTLSGRKLTMIEGVINGGTWEGGVIHKAVINGGTIKDTDIVYAIVKDAILKDCVFREGYFHKGLFSGGLWVFGIARGGTFINVTIKKGSFTGVDIKDCDCGDIVGDGSTIRHSTIRKGLISDTACIGCNSSVQEFEKSSWNEGTFYGDFKKSWWIKSHFINGVFDGAWWQSGVWENGLFKDGIWDGGIFKDGEFAGGEFWDGEFHGIFTGGLFGYGTFCDDAKWKNGEWKKARVGNAHGPIVYHAPPWTVEELKAA